MNTHRHIGERYLNDSLWEAVHMATENNLPAEHIAMTVLRTIATPEQIGELLQLAGELVGEERPQKYKHKW